MKKLFLSFSFVFLILLMASCTNRKSIAVPNLKLEDLAGNTMAADFEDEYVFVHFWATWCPPCRKEMPSIVAAANKLKGKDLRFLMISDEEPKTLERFLARGDYPMEFVHSTRNIKLYGVIYIPQTYLVKNGEVVASFETEQEWNSPEMIKLLESYMN